MTKAEQKRAVEKRTQQRLAARKEAAKKGAETRRAKREHQVAEADAKKDELKKHEDRLVAETRKTLDAEQNLQERQSAISKAMEARRRGPDSPEAAKAAKDKSAAHRGAPARPGMATVALRGEQAERFRALAAKHEMSLSKLLVRMMDVFEAAAK
jgi:hypothetical protein